MKCPSIACLWPSSPPSHLITSSLALSSSPSLFTGAADGSVVFWSLSSSPDNPNSFQPLFLLCGHSSPVTALSLSSSAATAADYDVVSASSDGILCAWAPRTHRCRRRRHLPPWAGSPSLVRPIVSVAGGRHLCIVCTGEASSVLIVDSITLSVVRTLARGALGIGPVCSMVIVGKDAILVDGEGEVLFLKTERDSASNQDGEGGSGNGDASSLVKESSADDARAVVISQDGRFLALILDSRCVFKLLGSGAEIGEVFHHIVSPVGGVFLQDESGTVDKIVLWRNTGAAAMYSISGLDGVFTFQPLCEIPDAHLLDERSLIHFCQFGSSLLRLESSCFELGSTLLWKPVVEIWSVPESNRGSSVTSSILQGVGGFRSCGVEVIGDLDKNSQQGRIISSPTGECIRHIVELDKHTISSSMVFSEGCYAPYAVIYGFYNGDIEVVRFVSLSVEFNSAPNNVKPHYNSCTLERVFQGHTGAVLCLAARCISRNHADQVCRVLISGSTDCTVRIWDLDSGVTLSVLHHHIAPVKQIILPPPWTDRPWNNCFLTVGEDACVALVSLETLRVERMLPGHPNYPSMVAWDSARGYVACLCRSISPPQPSSLPLSSKSSESGSVLYLWDVKSGARERIIRGTASHSMFDHFCRGIAINSITGNILGGCTSASSLLLPFLDDPDVAQSHGKKYEKGRVQMHASGFAHKNHPQMGKGKLSSQSVGHNSESAENSSMRLGSSEKVHQSTMHPVKSSCPFAGIATLEFDLLSLMTVQFVDCSDNKVMANIIGDDMKEQLLHQGVAENSSDRATENHNIKNSLEHCLLRISLCFLHLWDVDKVLDKLLNEEMEVYKPDGFYVAPGVLGDRGSLTLVFPGLHATLELWKSSSEFCAMRSLAIVSLAQRIICLSHSSMTASSALAAFYARNFAEKVPDIKAPLLQLLVSFWQHPSEHVRMAARSLFHCAAPRAVPRSLCAQKIIEADSSVGAAAEYGPSDKENANKSIVMDSERPREIVISAELEESGIFSWLEPVEIQEWICWIGGTNQDAMASHIIVAAALVVWYPSIVKENLDRLVVNHLIKLVMSMNDMYSSTAAELLAEGMESTWKACLGAEILHLINDIYFQVELLTGSKTNNAAEKPALAVNMREALVEILLPNLAMADITGFLNVIEGQIWATSSDSPVHLVSLKTLIRVVRGSPKPLAPYLDKAVNYILHTMDPGNLVLRKSCLNSSMAALREITRAFPMVAMNGSSTRLAVGDAIGDIHNVTIRVYDVESVTKIKILDASGPLGLPNILEGASRTKMVIAISSLSFSPDGEGLVAFSENGLMIRWWSLGVGWWEKLSRNLVPVQCTKLIFVPPWEGFSPSSARSSIMAGIFGNDKRHISEDSPRELDDAESLKALLRNLDLSYRLQWVDGRNIRLTRHGQELGTYPL